jgi:hypothetical protein
METWGVEVISTILYLGINGGELLVSRFGRFTLRKRGCVGFRVVLDTVE